MRRYEKDILHVIRYSERPIRMRDIVKAIDPDGRASFSDIGLTLTDLSRRGVVSREMCDGFYHYQIAPEGEKAANENRIKEEKRQQTHATIKAIVSAVRHDMADDEIEALAAYLRNRGILPG